MSKKPAKFSTFRRYPSLKQKAAKKVFRLEERSKKLREYEIKLDFLKLFTNEDL